MRPIFLRLTTSQNLPLNQQYVDDFYNMDPSDNVMFRTQVELNPEIESSVKLYMKLPQSDRNQKVLLVSCDLDDYKIHREGFASVFEYSINQKTASAFPTTEINTILNIDVEPYDFILSDESFPPTEDEFDDLPKVKEYLGPNEQPSNEVVSFISSRLTTNCATITEAVKSIVQWVSDTLFFDYEGGPYKKLDEILHGHKGTCVDYSHLTSALLRVVGIPARVVQGLVSMSRPSNKQQQWLTHSWVEYYDPTYNWIPVDPIFRPPLIGRVTATHIKLFTSFDCHSPLYVVEYDPSFNNGRRNINVTNSIFVHGSLVKLEVVS